MVVTHSVNHHAVGLLNGERKESFNITAEVQKYRDFSMYRNMAVHEKILVFLKCLFFIYIQKYGCGCAIGRNTTAAIHSVHKIPGMYFMYRSMAAVALRLSFLAPFSQPTAPVTYNLYSSLNYARTLLQGPLLYTLRPYKLSVPCY